MLPKLLTHGGPVIWLLLAASATVVAVFIERLLHYHRRKSFDGFINGMRNVLKRDKCGEALSICGRHAGPGGAPGRVAI